MNPHVARFEGVEAKERLFTDDSEDAEGPLLSMQRREGENRIETVAVILDGQGMQSDGVYVYGEKNQSRGGGNVEDEGCSRKAGEASKAAGWVRERGVVHMRVFALTSTYPSAGG